MNVYILKLLEDFDGVTYDDCTTVGYYASKWAAEKAAAEDAVGSITGGRPLPDDFSFVESDTEDSVWLSVPELDGMYTYRITAIQLIGEPE